MKKHSLILVAISLALILIARSLDDSLATLQQVLMIAWFLTLPFIAYFSTPSNSVYGKIAFGSSILAILGLGLKVLNFEWANTMIIVGLAGVVGAYAVMWIKSGADI